MDKKQTKKFLKQQETMKDIVADDFSKKAYERCLKNPKLNV